MMCWVGKALASVLQALHLNGYFVTLTLKTVLDTRSLFLGTEEEGTLRREL